jgi:hypothetical protein
VPVSYWSGFARRGDHGWASTICEAICCEAEQRGTRTASRIPVPMKPGRPARHDYEYERNGTANLFILFAPLGATSKLPIAIPRPTMPRS